MNLPIKCPTTGYPMVLTYDEDWRTISFSMNSDHMWECIDNDPGNTDAYHVNFQGTNQWFNEQFRNPREKYNSVADVNRYLREIGVSEQFPEII